MCFGSLISTIINGGIEIYNTFSKMDHLLLVVLFSEMFGIPPFIVEISLIISSIVSMVLVFKRLLRKYG